jgi:hypothetical protein
MIKSRSIRSAGDAECTLVIINLYKMSENLKKQDNLEDQGIYGSTRSFLFGVDLTPVLFYCCYSCHRCSHNHPPQSIISTLYRSMCEISYFFLPTFFLCNLRQLFSFLAVFPYLTKPFCSRASQGSLPFTF